MKKPYKPAQDTRNQKGPREHFRDKSTKKHRNQMTLSSLRMWHKIVYGNICIFCRRLGSDMV